MPDVRRGDLNEAVPGSLWSKHGRAVIVLARYWEGKKVKIVVLDAHGGLRVLQGGGTFLWDHMFIMGAA